MNAVASTSSKLSGVGKSSDTCTTVLAGGSVKKVPRNAVVDRKIAEISEVLGQFDHIVQRTAGRFHREAKPVQDPPRLRRDRTVLQIARHLADLAGSLAGMLRKVLVSADDLHGRRIGGNDAGKNHKIARSTKRRITRKWLGDID